MSSTGSLRAKITGTGMCIPGRVVTNHDLAGLMDTSDEWIRQRTGIVERHYVADGEENSDMCVHAAREALDRANVGPEDLDLILVGDLVNSSLSLELPHPRFRERRFVLEPLFEIAPDLVDPVTGLTVTKLLARLDLRT